MMKTQPDIYAAVDRALASCAKLQQQDGSPELREFWQPTIDGLLDDRLKLQREGSLFDEHLKF